MKRMSGFAVAITAIGMMMMTACGGLRYIGNANLKSDVDSAFYAIGVLQGTGYRDGLKTLPGADSIIHNEALFAGLFAAYDNKASQLKMTPDEAQAYIQTYVTMAQTKEADKAKAKEDAFLASNKTKPGVITTESGLQYRVITEGTGENPKAESTVIVHYTGKLLDGTVFDSSVERGEPVTFPVNRAIRGYSEVLQLMPVGSKYQVWIPFNLAYGPQPPQGSTIKPYSTLEFEIELLGIEVVKPESEETDSM